METWSALDQAEMMKRRTKKFALDIVYLFKGLPREEAGRVIGKQVLPSGTSVAANYRAVCRARTRREFISKMSVVVEEADETVFWLEMLGEAGLTSKDKIGAILNEFRQLLAIFAASGTTRKFK